MRFDPFSTAGNVNFLATWGSIFDGNRFEGGIRLLIGGASAEFLEIFETVGIGHFTFMAGFAYVRYMSTDW